MIRTKLHILADNVDPRDMSPGRENAVVKAMLAAASFVIDKEVLELLRRDDASKSIKALIEAGMAKLPYNPMVVEYEVNPKWHEFVMLREKDGAIYGRISTMDTATTATMVANNEIKMTFGDGRVYVWPCPGDQHPDFAVFRNSFMVGVNLALLMLNTKGIEKELVTVAESLNKKRTAKGKPRIPVHSIVHIGTIYRRDGTAIKRGEGGGGWHLPMHWRCGHTRTQHFGKGREETKIIYIPPCIVNFKPEDDAPEAPHRKVKV